MTVGHLSAGSGSRENWFGSGDEARAAGRRPLAGLIKRSFSLAGHRTSVALEEEFWAALGHIATQRQQTITALVAATDAGRGSGQPLASALRVLALREFFPVPLTSS
jgi:predicted DNA-binding ribbon-helix-helix protein